MAEPRRFNLRVLVLLSLGHLVTDVYQGALPGLLPLLKSRLGLSYAAAGAILLASSLTSSIIQPLFGLVSDRKQKPLLLPLGCLCAGVGFSMLSLPTAYAPILCLVALSGLGVASFHPEGYKTASFFTGERVAAGMALFSVGGNLGFALGPILCLWLVTRLGLDFLPLLVVPSLLLVALLLSQWKTIGAAHRQGAAQGGVRGVPDRKTRLALGLLLGTVIARSWTQMGLMTYLPFYYIDHLKGDPVYAGKLVSALLLGGVAGTLLGSPLADRWGHKRYLVLSLLGTTLLFPLLLVTQGLALFLSLGLFGAVLVSTFTVTVVMAQRLLPHNLGVASGLMVGFAIGAGGAGVTLLGAVADRFGVPAALHAIGALPIAGLLLSVLLPYPERGGETAA